MKRLLIVSAVIGLLFLPATQNAGAATFQGDCDDDPFRGEDISIDIEDGVMIIECEENDDTIEITDDQKLYINGKLVKTNRSQERLLGDYYDQFEDITEYATEIGIEGAKIGVKGAEIGLKAVANLVKLVLEDYDSDDLERDMDRESDKIERAAKKLEKKAEKLEEVAEDFKKTHRKLRRSIEELDDLHWF
ncbi:MAG: hypothetical protein JW814_04000 [Candidatus Krumholzibacteriota bacterium]|nr:hypothetical protein [Candidatus Krumholzibacteriota bacterium]